MQYGIKTRHICEQFVNYKRGVRLSTMNHSELAGGIRGLDFLGPVNGIYILVEVDFMKGVVRLDLCSAGNGEHVPGGLDRWVRFKGWMRKVFTDRGTHFMNSEVQGWMSMNEVELIFSLPYDHGSNGRQNVEILL